MVTKPTTPARETALSLYDDDAQVDDLTIDYPSSDGEPMAETDEQYTAMTYAVSALRVRYHDREDVYIAGDMLVYYRMNCDNIRVAPDVFVVFGATGSHRRDTWLVWREGKVPDFVMEIASPGTWRRDVGVKRQIYAMLGVNEYIRVDPTGQCFTPALEIDYLDGTAYRRQPVAVDEAGILRGYSVLLGLEICVLPGLELRLYDPATGQWLRSHQETEDILAVAESALRISETARQATESDLLQSEVARQAEAAARQTEAAARQAAEARAQQAEAETARLRAELQRLQQQ